LERTRRRGGRLPSPAEQSQWQRAQSRRRRARLSRRGFATLAAAPLVASLGFGASVVVRGAGGPAASGSAVSPVSAGPPPEAEAPEAPVQLTRLLPAGREALQFGAVAEDGSESGPVSESGVAGRLFEWVEAPPGLEGPLRVEYSLDAELTREVHDVLSQGRVGLGHVIVLDVATGRVLAYASTSPEVFPPTRTYPAASLVKVITAAAALDARPETARLPCRYSGSPYRLTRARLDPPARGNEVSLRRALAMSNNQCFAQLAVHALGPEPLVDAIGRFGWLSEPAPAHPAGSVDLGHDRYDLGRLGCGLAGSRITPLHAAQLAAVLAEGELVTPHWVDRVLDARGRELLLPARTVPRRVIPAELAAQLRDMLVDTTTRGTARGAFRGRGGRPLLGSVHVAGKTGSLSGRDPDGRYEWFAGVAPADAPRIAIATLVVQGELWWRNASQISAEVLRRIYCRRGPCRAENGDVLEFVEFRPEGNDSNGSRTSP
jgi:hypothetical protein